MSKCKKCGECCEDIPLYPSEFEMFKYILKAEGRWKPKDITFNRDKRLYKVNGRCPFLSDKNTCMIYSFRPIICKAYPGRYECKSSLKITSMEKVDE